jgi:peptidase E
MQRILALGGGGFMMEQAPSPIDTYMLSLTGKSKPKVCFVSTPSGDHPEHIDKFYAAFGLEACTPSHLAFFRKPMPGSIPLAHLETSLLDQDLIFVGGGNTKSALGVWREWRLDEVFRRASIAGVVLAGMSAGAMCWFESGLTDSFGARATNPCRV